MDLRDASASKKSPQWWRNFPGELQTGTHCICAKSVEKSLQLEIWSITSNSITLRGSPYPVTIVRKLSGQERCLRPTMLATIKCETYAPIIRTIQPICAILHIKEQAKVIPTLPNTIKNCLFLLFFFTDSNTLFNNGCLVHYLFVSDIQ